MLPLFLKLLAVLTAPVWLTATGLVAYGLLVAALVLAQAGILLGIFLVAAPIAWAEEKWTAWKVGE